MTSKPSIQPSDGPLAAMRGLQDALGVKDLDVDGWERNLSEDELATIRKEIEHSTPATKTLDGNLLIRRNSKEAEVLAGRIIAARNNSTIKKTDK